ncbi:MAG: PAS domain S-box protein [Thermodesulfovibrionia bacterium]|nr:PAS domain S-box protein [Thermodesulfovibrionia bacterium]
MKKKIIIGLSIFSLIFLLGGIYIISAIETATTKLDNLITLHQVEILREHLLIQMKRVQSDINLKNTRYARNIDTVISNVINMENTVTSCFSCHHDENMQQRLDDLRNDVNEYKQAVSRVFTIRANIERLNATEDRAFREGEHLINQVNNMISISSIKLADKTRLSLSEIAETKTILYILVFIIPFIAAGLGFIFIRGFTKPVNVLLKATRRLENGDLDYRIEGLKNEFGEVATAFNEMSDSLKQYMHKIQESEKRYRTLFESAGDAIFILEAEGENIGKIVSANQAAAEMHGYDINELLEFNLIKDLDTTDSAKEAPGRIQNILNGKWINAETTHRKKDGTVFPVEVSAGLLQYMDHKYILAFDRDISERKQIYEALRRSEQMKIVGEWSARLAHEIKNSLAGIKISVEVLVEELSMPEEDKVLTLKAVEEIKRIEMLLKSLLNFAKPPKPHFMITDVNDILDKTIAFSLKKPSFSLNTSSKINILKDFDINLPKTMADSMQLQQVFLNLLFNASEAMQNNGELTARTCYDAKTDAIQIEISDTGKGIDDKIKGEIFEPFFTTKSKGTGLGLAITKQLIEQHEGDICFSNKPGGGTTFYISLPVKRVKEEQIK